MLLALRDGALRLNSFKNNFFIKFCVVFFDQPVRQQQFLLIWHVPRMKNKMAQQHRNNDTEKTIELLPQDTCPPQNEQGSFCSTLSQIFLMPIFYNFSATEQINSFAIKPHSSNLNIDPNSNIVNPTKTLFSKDEWAHILGFLSDPKLSNRLICKNAFFAAESCPQYWQNLINTRIVHKKVLKKDYHTLDPSSSSSLSSSYYRYHDSQRQGEEEGEEYEEDTSLYADMGTYAVSMNRYYKVHCSGPKEQFLKGNLLKMQNPTSLLNRSNYSNSDNSKVKIQELTNDDDDDDDENNNDHYTTQSENHSLQKKQKIIDNAMMSKYRLKIYKQIYKKCKFSGYFVMCLKLLVAVMLLMSTIMVSLRLSSVTISNWLISAPLYTCSVLVSVIMLLLWFPTFIWPLRLYRAICKPGVGFFSTWIYAFSMNRRLIHFLAGLSISGVLFYMGLAAQFAPLVVSSTATTNLPFTIFSTLVCVHIFAAIVLAIIPLCRQQGVNMKLALIYSLVQAVPIVLALVVLIVKLWLQCYLNVAAFRWFIASLVALPGLLAHGLFQEWVSRQIAVSAINSTKTNWLRCTGCMISMGIWMSLMGTTMVATPLAFDMLNPYLMIPLGLSLAVVIIFYTLRLAREISASAHRNPCSLLSNSSERAYRYTNVAV